MPKGYPSPNPHRASTEASKLRQKRWRENNRQKIRDQHKRWRDANPEKHAAFLQNWRDKNPDKVSAQNRRYYDPVKAVVKQANERAKYWGAEGKLTVADFEALSKVCVCGEPATILDHRIAFCLGGSNWPENTQMLCDACNRLKTKNDNDERRHLKKYPIS